MSAFDFEEFARGHEPAVWLAPMEDVSCPVFRAICRGRGADVCFTEFVHADGLLDGRDEDTSKLALTSDDRPTAIQIYGADPRSLAEAASIAEAAAPAFLDVNCGCWVPKVARGGAGAGWLRDPTAMVAMAREIVSRVSLPVTVKTRIGWGDEAEMPIVDLARRLEDTGVRAITLHCRTAKMGHEGRADWRWAEAVQAAVTIPILVNGDVRSADDAHRALTSTGARGVMIGRRAIEHPWVFREVRARLRHAPRLLPPTLEERVTTALEHLDRLVEARGARRAVRAIRRHYPGYLRGVPDHTNVLRRLPLLTELAAVRAELSDILEVAPQNDESPEVGGPPGSP